MTVPVGIPLVGGVSLWVLFAPVTALSVAAGWVLAAIDRRLSRTAGVSAPTRLPERKLVRTAA